MPRTKNTQLLHGLAQDAIRLPDGRTYPIQELKNQVSRRKNYNLRTGRVSDQKQSTRNQLQVNFAARNIKYDLEDRMWQSEHTAEEIQQRYATDTLEQARSIQYKARSIVRYLKQHQVL